MIPKVKEGLGFKRSNTDDGVFAKIIDGELFVIAVYVDDFSLGGLTTSKLSRWHYCWMEGQFHGAQRCSQLSHCQMSKQRQQLSNKSFGIELYLAPLMLYVNQSDMQKASSLSAQTIKLFMLVFFDNHLDPDHTLGQSRSAIKDIKAQCYFKLFEEADWRLWYVITCILFLIPLAAKVQLSHSGTQWCHYLDSYTCYLRCGIWNFLRLINTSFFPTHAQVHVNLWWLMRFLSNCFMRCQVDKSHFNQWHDIKQCCWHANTTSHGWHLLLHPQSPSTLSLPQQPSPCPHPHWPPSSNSRAYPIDNAVIIILALVNSAIDHSAHTWILAASMNNSKLHTSCCTRIKTISTRLCIDTCSGYQYIASSIYHFWTKSISDTMGISFEFINRDRALACLRNIRRSIRDVLWDEITTTHHTLQFSQSNDAKSGCLESDVQSRHPD